MQSCCLSFACCTRNALQILLGNNFKYQMYMNSNLPNCIRDIQQEKKKTWFCRFCPVTSIHLMYITCLSIASFAESMDAKHHLE